MAQPGHMYPPTPWRFVVKLVGAYLVGCWTLLQFVDWSVARAGASPHCANLLLVVLLGLLPALILYLRFRENIEERGLLPWQRNAVLANGAVLLVVLFAAFGATDLGATTTKVAYTDADGERQTVRVAKRAYRRQVPVFAMVPESGVVDSATTWIGFASLELVRFALQQNPFLSPSTTEGSRLYNYYDAPASTTEEREAARAYDAELYVDGTYGVDGERVTLRPTVRARVSGQVLAKAAFTGTDIISLFDSVGTFVLANVGLTDAERRRTERVSFREAGTAKAAAFETGLKTYVAAWQIMDLTRLKSTTELDTTNAYANAYVARILYSFAFAPELQRTLIARAMRHRGRLPAYDRVEVLALDQLIRGNTERAAQLLEVQLQLDPDRSETYDMLARTQWVESDLPAMVQTPDTLAVRSPTPDHLRKASWAHLITGDHATARARAEQILARDLTHKDGQLLLVEADFHTGNYEAAQATVDGLLLTDPGQEPYLAPVLRAATYMAGHRGRLPDATPFEGEFFFPGNRMIADYSVVNGFPMTGIKNQQGMIAHPMSDTSWTCVNYEHATTMTVRERRPGRPYEAVDWFEKKPTGRELNYTLHRREPTGEEARALMVAGDYDAAAAAYPAAVAAAPLNRHLAREGAHVAYWALLSEEERSRHNRRAAGTYDGRELV